MQPQAPTVAASAAYGCSLHHLRLQAAARSDKEAKASEAKAAKDSEMEARAAAKAEQARYLVITPRAAAKAKQARACFYEPATCWSGRLLTSDFSL